MNYKVTEKDRKALRKSLWTLYKRQSYPRSVREMACDQALQYLITQLESDNPAYSDLRNQLTSIKSST